MQETEQKQVSAVPVEEVEGPSTLEEKFGPAEVKVKEGVAVDMLTGSEEEDSTSDDSSDDSDKDDGNYANDGIALWTVVFVSKPSNMVRNLTVQQVVPICCLCLVIRILVLFYQ